MTICGVVEVIMMVVLARGKVAVLVNEAVIPEEAATVTVGKAKPLQLSWNARRVV